MDFITRMASLSLFLSIFKSILLYFPSQCSTLPFFSILSHLLKCSYLDLLYNSFILQTFYMFTKFYLLLFLPLYLFLLCLFGLFFSYLAFISQLHDLPVSPSFNPLFEIIMYSSLLMVLVFLHLMASELLACNRLYLTGF